MGYTVTFIRRLSAAASLLLGLMFIAGTCFGQDAVSPSPKFDIQRFEVVGDTVLGDTAVQATVAPFIGKQKDFADIQRALEALEGAYRQRGYGVIKVRLPEQDITRGVVRFNIISPKIGKVIVDGNEHFSTENVRRSLPAVKEGETPNSSEIARNLQIGAEHPVKQTSVLLRSGAVEDLVDVNVRVKDDNPWRLVATLDNSGTDATGYYRMGLGYQHTNLFDRDHSLSLQYITSPTKLKEVAIYGFGYRIPYYGLNGVLDIYGGYSDVDSGTVGGLFDVKGKGTVFGGRWSYYLPRTQDIEHKAYAGLDYRAYQNNVTLGGIGFVPDITVHPASLGYAGRMQMTASELNFNASVSANLPGGNDGTQDDFTRTRSGATANYVIYRGNASFAHAYRSEWQSRAAMSLQYTRDLLIPGEQFGIGGQETVRGYLPREAANDKGYAVQLELYTPNFAEKLGMMDKWRSRMVGFYDFGGLRRNDPLPGEEASQYISSAGLGLRLSYGKAFSLRFDVAQILQAHGTRQTNEQRVSAGVAIIY